METKTFEELANESHQTTEKLRQYETMNRTVTGENEYTRFCLWCNAFNKGQGKSNPKIFAKYLQEENIELTFWQKKHLAEKYFGYEYDFNHETNKWKIKKKSA